MVDVGLVGTLLLTAYREVATPPVEKCNSTVSRGSYRVGCVGQTVELLLHLLQDVGGGAVLWFAVVDLIQDSVENLGVERMQRSQNWQLGLQITQSWF